MKKILIIRNDKLGDFMLAFPSFAAAKINLENTEIHALVPIYTQAMAEKCKWIDKVIIDPGANIGWKNIFSLLKQLKKEKYDAVIALFSTSRIGLITKLARIPYRLAPATKVAQFFYNNKLVQKRSRSEQPEYAYNMDLIYHFLKQQGINTIRKPDAPYLEFSEDEISTLRNNLKKNNSIPDSHKLIFVHPGNGGSASNLTPQQFSTLAKNIKSQTGHTIVITAGPGELDIAKIVAVELANTPHIIFESTKGLIDFSKHIQFADVFISGSTGPLHIAGALNTPTAGFYPRRRSATPLRWQTLNSDQRRLAFSPDANAEQEDMSAINLELAANKISTQYLMKT